LLTNEEDIILELGSSEGGIRPLRWEGQDFRIRPSGLLKSRWLTESSTGSPVLELRFDWWRTGGRITFCRHLLYTFRLFQVPYFGLVFSEASSGKPVLKYERKQAQAHPEGSSWHLLLFPQEMPTGHLIHLLALGMSMTLHYTGDQPESNALLLTAG
jgi:hypothetical protein